MFITKDFLLKYGFDNPVRWFDKQANQFRVHYKINGYDCDIFISPPPQTLGGMTPEEQVEAFSDIKQLEQNHYGDWAIYINNFDNHLTTIQTEQELINILVSIKAKDKESKNYKDLKVHYAPINLEGDIKAYRFNSQKGIINAILEKQFAKRKLVTLISINDEVYIADNDFYIALFINMFQENYTDIFLQEYSSYEEAYKVALMMKETSPLCYEPDSDETPR